MSKLVYFSFLFGFIFYSCSNTNENKANYTNSSPEIDKRECIKTPDTSLAYHISSKNDSLVSCVMFQVIAYDFFEMLDEKEDNSVVNFQRIDINGGSSGGFVNKACIEFLSDTCALEKPRLIFSDKNTRTIVFYYHYSSLHSILSILENNDIVVCNYKKWSETGSWAALSYYRVLNRDNRNTKE